MKHWNLKRVLSLLLVVCMVTGLLSGVSAMAEDQTANYHEISTDGLKLATEDNAAADETETEEAPYADTDVVRVFVHADPEFCVEQAMKIDSLPENEVRKKISEIDDYRARYYKHHTGHDWYDARNYDLSINSGVLGFEGVVEEIVRYMEVRSEFCK